MSDILKIGDTKQLFLLTGEMQRARPDEFIHIFVKNSQQLTEFLEAMIACELKPAAVVYNTLLELHLQNWSRLEGNAEVHQ